jgi:hypothetical protein
MCPWRDDDLEDNEASSIYTRSVTGQASPYDLEWPVFDGKSGTKDFNATAIVGVRRCRRVSRL